MINNVHIISLIAFIDHYVAHWKGLYNTNSLVSSNMLYICTEIRRKNVLFISTIFGYRL